MSTSTTAVSGGVGPCFVIFIVFMILKLVGVINWSWWWVLAPLWIPIGIVIAVLVVIFAIALVAGLIATIVKASTH